MTAVADILTRLAALGCRAELTGGGVAVVGAVEKIPKELEEAVRQAKPALVVELLRQKAWALKDLIDGDAPLAERLARLPEFLETSDKLAEAQEELFNSWRNAGFAVIWSSLVDEFILAGNSSPPPGSEDFAVYSWKEVLALKDASSETVRSAHSVNKVFGGMVRTCGKPPA